MITVLKLQLFGPFGQDKLVGIVYVDSNLLTMLPICGRITNKFS